MSTTLQRVSLLFERLTAHSKHPHAETYHQKWSHWIDRFAPQAEAMYAEDGHPVVFAFQTPQGVNISCYRWAPGDTAADDSSAAQPNSAARCTWPSEQPEKAPRRILASSNWRPIDWSSVKGALFWVHGVTDHSRFELLRLKNLHTGLDTTTRTALTKDDMQTLLRLAKAGKAEEEYEGSWAQYLVNAGIVVYAADLQGHGLSGAWEGSRCNVKHFSNFVDDIIDWMSGFMAYQEWRTSMPLFLSGLSMGGCVVSRVIEVGFSERRLSTWNEDRSQLCPTVPRLKGLLLFCPALSAERLKKKLINRIGLSVGRWLSDKQPKLKVAALEKNKAYPYINEILDHDPLIYTSNMPARLGYEVVQEMSKILPNKHQFPSGLAMTIIQSRLDTMTDPEGSQKFVEEIACTDKQAIFLDFAWHFLTKEPGNLLVAAEAVKWILQRA